MTAEMLNEVRLALALPLYFQVVPRVPVAEQERERLSLKRYLPEEAVHADNLA